MKIIRYLLLFSVIFVLVFAAGYYYKIKNTENALVSPLAGVKTPKTPTFSLENAPAESLRGKIATMSGEISWQGRVATEASKILTPLAVQQGEKLVTGEKSSLSLAFPNAVSVEFSEKTDIEIIQTLPANIVFYQASGTGEYVKTGSYPVSVRAKNILVEDDGDIVISIDSKKPIITLVLKSGKATAAFNDLKIVSHEVTIVAGQTYTFNDDTRRGVLK